MPRPPPEVTIVVPTFNERLNVPILVDRLRKTLEGESWEVVFVDDDSADGTIAAVRSIGEQDSRVRGIRRIGRRGLSGACVEGALASQAKFVAVMDADLQHDETVLTTMLARARQDDVDLVVASRYAEGGSIASFSGRREKISRWSTALARRLLGVEVTDPMSGFFLIRREVVEELAPSLSSQGFKILLDLVITARGSLRFAEVPFEFQHRLHGDSKLDARVALDFIALVVGKLSYGLVSLRFILFCLVGLSGLGLHMLLLGTSLNADVQFGVAQTLSTVIVIAWNFMLNNALTYRDQRLRGWRMLWGMLRFELICGISVVSNVGVASWVYDYNSVWWVAGLTGALVGTMWNYLVSAALVWQVR